jgi:hypothetical protein
MWHLEIPEDATAEEAAAAIAAIESLLRVEGTVEMSASKEHWVRAARLEAQGLPIRGNESSGWRVRSHV